MSILQFADDALIMGDWSFENVNNLSRFLTCSYMASGLKVNFSKRKIFGIGVSHLEVSNFASILGYQASKFSSIYLGLPIGSNMCNHSNWTPIISKFQKMLSNWKSKILSVGGRLTLLKSVLGSLTTYYFSLLKAPLKVVKNLESIRRIFFLGWLF